MHEGFDSTVNAMQVHKRAWDRSFSNVGQVKPSGNSDS